MKFKPGDDFDRELYDLDTTEYVCASHIDEEYIESKITEKGVLGKCDYCNKKKKVVPLSELLKIIICGINYLYEDPGDSRYLNKEGIHGYDGDTFDFYDLWNDRLGLYTDNESLSEDIYKYLENDSLYCRKDEYVSESDHLDSLWLRFKDTVKYKARFVFYFKDIFKDHEYVDPFYILKKVQKSIKKFNLITELPVNTKLYRTRQHLNPKDVTEASHIASAPHYLAKAFGRMNPSGISMFYCSENKDLTIAEVVDITSTSMMYFTTAIFRNKKSLRLVDFTKLPDMPSVFDSANNVDRETIFFLKQFIEDISKPINTWDTVIEYIPTQIITEYIKFNDKLDVEGMIYNSSKIKGKKNIVLFFNHEESLDNLKFSSSSIKTTRL